MLQAIKDIKGLCCSLLQCVAGDQRHQGPRGHRRVTSLRASPATAASASCCAASRPVPGSQPVQEGLGGGR